MPTTRVPVPSQSPAALVTSLKGSVVLAVEDHPDSLALITTILERLGLVVLGASSAREAFQRFTEGRPQLIISDIGLPGEDGYSLMKRIRRLSALDGGATPAVALTALSRAEDRRQALAAGFHAHLTKPLEPDDLIKAINALLSPTVPAPGVELRSTRLLLRRWTEGDRAPFTAMHADPVVMEFMPGVLGADQCDALIARNLQHSRDHGFGLWSLEIIGRPPFIGYAGLLRTSFVPPFTPCVEIAWMLARDAWGQGYATEAAGAVCQRAFGELGLDEIVSFTAAANTRSRRVMERLHMTHDEAEDFDHPQLPEGHQLRRHVLYRLTNERWSGSSFASTD